MKTYHNISKHTKTYQNILKRTKTYQNILKYTKTYTNFSVRNTLALTVVNLFSKSYGLGLSQKPNFFT